MRPLVAASFLLVADFADAFPAQSGWDICNRVYSPTTTGLSNQDQKDGRETKEACIKEISMFWWPADLPAWTAEQYCSETWRHNISEPKLEIPNVKGKNVLITGGDTGLGFATMKALALSGANVSYTSRNCNCEANKYTMQIPEQCGELAALRSTVQATHSYPLKCIQLDLLRADSLVAFVKEAIADYSETGLDILLNNAGLVDDVTTADRIFHVNYVGTFAVTKGLWSLMLETSKKGRDVRILTTSSVERLVLNREATVDALRYIGAGKTYPYTVIQAQQVLERHVADPSTKSIPIGYSFSKLADLMFAYQLQDALEDSPAIKNMAAFSTHPGASYTLMARNLQVGQLTRDQGVLPNLLAISTPLDQLDNSKPRFFGPALNRFDQDHYGALDAKEDTILKQGALFMKYKTKDLDAFTPVDAVSCLQMVGAPAQYTTLRPVEADKAIREKLWLVGEAGIDAYYGDAFKQLNAKWTDLKHPEATSTVVSEPLVV
eukprot:TRINITY_DN102449_c0_g1_i1.p1 TRINITY_DN102449_c0_g1~~TRINITY_DN102449_c0_g1_i1.p1  ORF type:complete len:493 (+),score=96.82 TRINITY_DN102449_c0_g1_i1:96-1574(+)